MGRAFGGIVAVVLGTIVLSCVQAHGDDFEPRVCAAAVEYVGEPLHAPLNRQAWAGLDCSLDGGLPAELAAQLDEAVPWILDKTRAPGITAAVGIPGVGMWSVSRGMATTAPPTPVDERSLFHWASAGKTFTATVVMQLIEEGRLSYDAPLATWFPDFPNASAITIDHLLTHTNGIFSFNADLKFRRQTGYHPPETLLAIAKRHGCVCCPGERWYYSNTGYVLLGLIVERIEGRPLDEVVRARIIRPLGLAQMVALSPGRPPKELVPGHVEGRPDRGFEPTTPYGAGNIGASAADMVRFWQALLAGRVLRPETIEQAFARLYPMFQPGMYYGRGVMLTEFTDRQQRKVTWLGHSGGTPGLKAVVGYDLDARIFIAVAVNSDAPAEAAANKLREIVIESRSRRE